MQNTSARKVALLAGGTSREREISLASGKGAEGALIEAGYSVDFLDPSNKADIKKLIDEDYDVAFLCMHGKQGEDGTIQGLLEMIGIPYTCSGVQASANAIDKIKSKVLFETVQIPTAFFVVLKSDAPYDTEEIISKLGLPCVVKPATEGSALGVEIVTREEDLAETIDRVLKVDNTILIEQFIEGTEITVAILGNEETEPLPVIEIIPTGEFYDFESKYAPGGSKHICPAGISDAVTIQAQDYAQRAHKVLGCRGVSRSDFIIDKDGKPWILETNTIPGMTPTSLLPDAARAAGISFPELCTKLIDLAIA